MFLFKDVKMTILVKEYFT